MVELSASVTCETEGSGGGRQPGPILPSGPGGRPPHSCKELLRQAGFRLTRQRVALARILFSRGARHVTAETLYHEAAAARLRVSLATVYNTLRQLTGAGLLREIAAGGSRAFFDTNLSEHHHFFVEGDEAIIDLPPGYVELGGLPDVPPGYEIARVDVVVRLRRRCG